MKKIGLITIFNSRNYGACLQALATVLFLADHGYDVELINYTTEFDKKDLKWAYKENNKFSGYIKSLIKNIIFGKMSNYKVIHQSLLKYCKVSTLCVTSDDVDKLSYDILASGSDQIWNSAVTKLDSVYLLRHGRANKRVSLASSMGSNHIKEEDKAMLREAFKGMDFISVREKFAQDEIKEIIDKPVKVIIDPTLWISGDYWKNKIAVNSKYNLFEKKYIATYFVSENKDEYTDFVRSYAEHMGLPVYDILFVNYKRKYADKYMSGLTVEDFVAIIKNAEIVITDSFHGTAFSVNMQKNFVALLNKKNPIRVRELLFDLNLSSRIELPASEFKEIDYSIPTEILRRKRKESSEWITKALE